MLCPCGSNIVLEACCGVYINEHHTPPTAEALMRSRYTAYTQANMDYIKNTMRGKPLLGFNGNEAALWANHVKWVGLEVKKAFNESEDVAFVEFIATLLDQQKLERIHEISEFHREDGVWYYVDGKNPSKSAIRKPAKNALCPCGSKKKYKNCHAK
jgi:SEC-C motif-containing protein